MRQAKLRQGRKNGLQRIKFSGIICVATTDLPRLCRDTGPPLRRVFVFLGLRSLLPNHAVRFRLFAIRVNAFAVWRDWRLSPANP